MAHSIISMRAQDNSIVKLECHDRIESCASLMRDYAADPSYSDRFAVIAEQDFSYGGDTKGMYMSLLLRPSLFPSQAGLLTALATVALVKALEEHTTKRLGIGWVGGVYCEGKHIGGVTIEGKLDNYATYEYIIVNFAVRLPREDFPPRLTDMIKKVFESNNNSIATIIAKNVLNKFFPFYANMKTSTSFMASYHKRFILSGTKVKLIEDGKRRSCKVLSVDTATSALIVETKKEGIKHITRPASVIIPKKVKLKK